MRMKRRKFIKDAFKGTLGLLAIPLDRLSIKQDFPVQQLTSNPNYHWFGYYDKLQTDPSGRYILGMEVDFEGRSPNPDDILDIGMVDNKKNNKWIKLGETKAWGWQQGCMLQWRPPDRYEVLWNDREGEDFVARL